MHVSHAHVHMRAVFVCSHTHAYHMRTCMSLGVAYLVGVFRADLPEAAGGGLAERAGLGGPAGGWLGCARPRPCCGLLGGAARGGAGGPSGGWGWLAAQQAERPGTRLAVQQADRSCPRPGGFRCSRNPLLSGTAPARCCVCGKGGKRVTLTL